MKSLEARKQSICERLAITHSVTLGYIEEHYNGIIAARLSRGASDEEIIAAIAMFLELPNAAIAARCFGEALSKAKAQGLI